MFGEGASLQSAQYMDADEVSPAVWSIQICDSNKCDGKDHRPLQANVKNGQWRNVVFADYGQAVKLAHGLRTVQKSTIPGSNLTFNYPSDPPNPKESLIPVERMDDACKPEKTEEISRR